MGAAPASSETCSGVSPARLNSRKRYRVPALRFIASGCVFPFITKFGKGPPLGAR
jgi:hypothetical protein